MTRRDFLLDSGGVTALAADRNLLAAYLDLVTTRFDGALLVPISVLTEVRTGRRAIDVKVDRLLNAIGTGERDSAVLTMSAAVAARAGVVRTDALDIDSTRHISIVDAQIVALAEERSLRHAVTIVTGDERDINLLLSTINRPNIGVDVL